MNEMSIKIDLDESTRKECIFIRGEAYSLHVKDDMVVITDNSDYAKIYAVYAFEFFYQKIAAR